MFVKLLNEGEFLLMHDMSDQRVTLALAQVVENGLGHALPCLRLEARLDRLLQVAGDGEALLGCSCCTDDPGPLDNGGDRHPKALNNLQRLPQLLHIQFVGKSWCCRLGVSSSLNRCLVAPCELGDQLIDLVHITHFIGLKDPYEIIRATCHVALDAGIPGQTQELRKQCPCYRW